MNLPIQTIELDAVLKKSDKEAHLEEISVDILTNLGGFRPGSIASPEEVKACFSYMTPMCAIPLEDGTWMSGKNKYDDVAKTNLQLLPLNNTFLEGERYIELSKGIYLKKNSDERVKISNARVRVVGVRKEWESEVEYKKRLVCEIRCEAWNGGVKTIEVPVEQYKQLYRFIRQKYPEISLSTTGMDALEDYLTEVFQNEPVNLLRESYTRRTGWMKLEGHTKYYIGCDPFYSSYKLPDVSGMDKLRLFKEGCSFLDVGKSNMAIVLIMLVAHIGYSLYWFKQGKMDFRSVLFIKGGTNMLKTSVAREVSNVFDVNRDHAVIRIASTLASLQHNICMLKDQVVCLDDFSNSETKSKNKAVEAAEDAIRAVGDGSFPTKMSLKDTGHVARNTVRAALLLTGEEDLGLGMSSNLRTIVVPVTEETFDGEILIKFQQNPAILQQYFALYIFFLTEYGEDLSRCCQQLFPQYRREYAKTLKIPRYIDAAAGLRVQVDFFVRFAAYCNVTDVEQAELKSLCEMRIVEVLQQNQQVSGEKKPDLRFLYALMQSLGNTPNKGLSDNEEAYVLAESQYLGFYEKEADLIWVRWEDAWELVVHFYKKQGDVWLVKPQTIKELLLKKDISSGRKMPEGKAGNEYLRRARKGMRKRMLVLRKSIVEKLLKSKGENY